MQSKPKSPGRVTYEKAGYDGTCVTYAQIAFDADSINRAWGLTWAEASDGTRVTYMQIAAAVAREVRRRAKRKVNANS